MANGIFGNANGFFTPERSAAFQALGLGLSQLGAGQQVNLSQPLAALQKRQQDAKTREQLEGLSGRFTPDQQAILATMSPAQAAQIIAQDAFRAPAAPIKGVVINGQLVNPITGQPMGDFRDAPEQPSTGFIVSGQQALEDYGLDPSGSYNITTGPEGVKASRIGGGGTSVNVDLGGGPFDVPPNFKPNPNFDPSRPASRENPDIVPIFGGPADIKAAEAAEAAEAGLSQQEESDVLQARSADIVLQDIGRARGQLASEGALPVSGFGSGLFRGIAGSPAADFNATLSTIRSNIGFDRLQQMRDASPTGGALGQVSERELSELQAVLGSLSQDQSDAQLDTNLARLETLYGDIMDKFRADPALDSFFDDATPAPGEWRDLGGGIRIREKQ